MRIHLWHSRFYPNLDQSVKVLDQYIKILLIMYVDSRTDNCIYIITHVYMFFFRLSSINQNVYSSFTHLFALNW